MSSPVPVPHRLQLPTTQIGNTYGITPLRSSDAYEKAYDLASSEFQAYAGFPGIQQSLLAEALDDVMFADEVDLAAARIAGLVRSTRLFEYRGLTVKDETQQVTKAYKARGAANFILKHAQLAQLSGVVTSSAGNHGQGVALAASSIGVEAVVVVPWGTPEVKKQGIRAHGGRVVEAGSDYAGATQKAKEINRLQGGLLVPAFNHRDIMAGQATVVKELLAQTDVLNNLVVPTGGGGLLAGSAKYLAVRAPNIKVFAAGVANGSAVETAFKQGNNGTTDPNTFADGIAVDKLGDVTWPEIKRHVAGVLTADELTLRKTIGHLFMRGYALEGAGAVGIAAALTWNQLLPGRTAVIATGGNIDPEVLAACRELVETSKPERLTRQPEFSTI